MDLQNFRRAFSIFLIAVLQVENISALTLATCRRTSSYQVITCTLSCRYWLLAYALNGWDNLCTAAWHELNHLWP